MVEPTGWKPDLISSSRPRALVFRYGVLTVPHVTVTSFVHSPRCSEQRWNKAGKHDLILRITSILLGGSFFFLFFSHCSSTTTSSTSVPSSFLVVALVATRRALHAVHGTSPKISQSFLLLLTQPVLSHTGTFFHSSLSVRT